MVPASGPLVTDGTEHVEALSLFLVVGAVARDLSGHSLSESAEVDAHEQCTRKVDPIP